MPLTDAIGRVGLWTFQLDTLPMAKAQETAAEIEELGYGAIWVPEAAGRDALVNSALLLSGTRRIAVATGIATIWGRDPSTAAMGHRTLTEAFPERFVFGLGISHPNLVGARGHTWAKPVTAMRQYLDTMDKAPFMAIPAPPESPPRKVLAALGPKMLELASMRTDGAHPYFVPVEHTAFARRELGEVPLLAPEQAVVLETDPEKARAIARNHMRIYLGLPNYTNNLRRMGFSDEDIDNGGSDRLVDAIVAWGDIDTVVSRVKAHHDAGADHVCVQPVADPTQGFPIATIRRLSEALLPS